MIFQLALAETCRENSTVTLPYVTAPGCLGLDKKRMHSNGTPPSISQDFVKTILKIPGGSGNQVTAYLRKIGFASSDGSPTDLY